MRKREPLFSTEAEMCAAFSEWTRKQGWVPYPETEGWDILLVGSDGTQIGVQAKLKFNMKVLEQCLPSWMLSAFGGSGPDFRAILLPEAGMASGPILGALGLTAFHPQRGSWQWRKEFHPRLASNWSDWHYWNPEQRHKLPEYVPDVPAGASGPVQLTRWKIGALRVAATLEIRGHVTREDFRRHGVDPRRWIGPADDGSAWLIPGAVPGQYIRGPGLRFAEQHPVVFATIREEIASEMVPA